MSPQKCSMARSLPDLMHSSLDQRESAPKWHLDQSSYFCTAHPCAALCPTQRHTDHAMCDICSNRPHLCNAYRQCGLKYPEYVPNHSQNVINFPISYIHRLLQWRNFFSSTYASCSGRHDVGQRNVNILQHLQSDRRSGASTKLFLNLPIFK